MALNPVTGGLIQAGLETGVGLLNMMTQRTREERALEHQKELMSLQFKNQKELDAYGQQLQMETWKQTNYPAQVAMLKEAGLNPGLLYGKGGPGGVTGSQTGGSAASGNAPAPQPIPMELGNALKMGAEVALINAQAKKAQAEAKAIETTAIPEAQTRMKEAGYRMENLQAITANEQAKNALIKAETDWQNIQNNIASQSSEGLIKQVFLNNKELENKIRLSCTQTKIAEATIDQSIQQVYQTTIEQAIRIALDKENITKIQAETEEIRIQIKAISSSILQNWTSLFQEGNRIEIAKNLMKFNTSWPMKAQQWTGILGALISGAKDASTTFGSGGPVLIKGFGK